MTDHDQAGPLGDPEDLGEPTVGIEHDAEVDDLAAAEPDNDPIVVEQIYSETPAVEGAPQNARPEDAPAFGMSADGGGS